MDTTAVTAPSIDARFASEDSDMKQKRKRKRRAVVSCNACRRRKLKCDREQPCDRCIKGGVVETCAYNWHEISHADDEVQESAEDADEREINPESGRPTKKNGIVLGGGKLTGLPFPEQKHDGRVEEKDEKIHQLKARLVALESQLPLNDGPSGLDRSYPANEFESKYPGASSLDDGFFKGRGYKTQFYGSSSPLSILTHFPEVRILMKEIYPNSTLQRLQRDCRALEARVNQNASAWTTPPYAKLLELIPSRSQADRLCKLYFDTFETTYRILHAPTFWARYAAFWDDPDGTLPEFLVVLLLLMACVLCTSPEEPIRFTPNGSWCREQATTWIHACDAWVRAQSNKHRTLATYQIRILRVIAASVNCLKTKEYYVQAEGLLIYMKSAGMHRNPSLLVGRCTPFEAEMRRRMWATTMEIELQASLDRGTASMLVAVLYDCPPPANINDEDFGENDAALPQSKPLDEFTDTSYLHHSYRTLLSRMKLSSTVQDQDCRANFDDLLQREQRIMDAIGKIPQWEEPRALQARTLLNVQLRQFLTMLYSPFLQQGPEAYSRSRYSRTVCFDACIAMVDAHVQLIEVGNFALCLMRQDHVRVSLLLCQMSFRDSFGKVDTFSRTLTTLFVEAMDKALRILEERAMRPGRGFHMFWFVSAAFSLVQIRTNPELASIYKLQATDRVSKLYYRILAMQESLSRPPLNVPVDAITPFQQQPPDPLAGPLDGFDFVDDWTLGDMWSFNFDPFET
ncbi:uncharacterized protein BDZ99DRAFT_414077 [Mytilinidion resinicola]|uniref:Zn(2)-C6 fungal-type domain-containing protein n=1 Tax=Mytilinidion resinicola TaxID=574789 RepID=A0A6A6YRN2_9PEZI|nr:uncharacterized protein BDZ99DRAFT_414077 [Mytilinidion resinicola]KAF2811596.1 hypothetical protein BDZ99DRAFT_414077 [Mytilinidion resinicola]